jgi:hypothetical protein
MTTTTTQDAFHPMRGHVDAGATVRMNSGAILTVRPDRVGWRVVDETGAQVSPSDMCAYELMDFIINGFDQTRQS